MAHPSAEIARSGDGPFDSGTQGAKNELNIFGGRYLNDFLDEIERTAIDMRTVEVSILEREVVLKGKEIAELEMRSGLLAARCEDLKAALEKTEADLAAQKAKAETDLAALGSKGEADLAALETSHVEALAKVAAELDAVRSRSAAEQTAMRDANEAALTDLRAERDAEKSRSVALEAKLKRVQRRARDIDGKLKVALRRVGQLQRSTSWKVTRPLRQISVSLRRFRLLPATRARTGQRGSGARSAR